MSDSHARILEAAWKQAHSIGFAGISRRLLAAELSISIGSVSNYPGGMSGLRADLVRRIIERADVALLAQALAGGHVGALEAPAEMREAAGRIVAGLE